MLESRSMTICVIIAAKDAETTIGRAVVSALAQAEASEVVVVDDGSTDGTVAAARSHADASGRLNVISLSRNVGPAAARNEALRRTHAKYVCALDADDFLLPGRLAKLLVAAGDGSPLIADDLLVAPVGTESGPYGLLCAQGAEPRRLDLCAFVEGNISDPRRPRQELGFLKPLMDRCFLERHALTYNPALRLGEDYALYAAALARGGHMKLIGACGYVALTRPGSLSNTHTIADLRALIAADDALVQTAGLSSMDITMIRRHQKSVVDRLKHRYCLDARRAGQWWRFLWYLLESPSTTRFIGSAALRKLGWAPKAAQGTGGPRFYPSERELTFIRQLPAWSQREPPSSLLEDRDVLHGRAPG